MQNLTKYALEDSLKKFLLKKPLDKITISDLTSDCGISRMAFYYHFKDIYDLVECPALKTPRERWMRKRLMKRGSRDFYRSSRRYRITSPLF